MKSKLTVLLIMAANYCLAANTTEIECESYADNSFKGICVELPNYREIRGGTKIRTTYAAECPEELIGAFDYAVKIWEENLPSMLPLNVTVKWSKIRGSKTAVLSKVQYKTLESDTELDRQYLSTMSQIKAVALKEIHLQRTHRFYDVVDEVTKKMDLADITITYNSDLYNEYSFSIDDIMSNKYDFVSLAIRDIAKGLGFGINIIADDEGIVFLPGKKTFYESLIWSELKNETPASAYTKCTQGSLNVTFLPLLYAPNPWQNGISLQYYIPDETDPLSMLLSYDFGKGYIMRNLSGFDWENKFQYVLDWQAMMTTGGTTNSKFENGSTDNNLPFKGNIDLSSVSRQTPNNITNDLKPIESVNPSAAMQTNSTTSYSELCEPYNYFYTGDKKVYYGYSISVLLKNGSWDVVYAEYYPTATTIKVEDLPLNYPTSEYARSCSGGLRYRLTKCEWNAGSSAPKKYYVKYFTRDYFPQKANIKYSKIHEESENISLSEIRMSDDYYVDVEIGLSNIEGTNKIIVEQLDEGERVPFRYEATDFRQGYFIANLDRELSTQLTVISYNDNGNTRSNTIVIPAIGYDDLQENISFDICDNHISTNGIDRIQPNASYTITNMINANFVKTEKLPTDGIIDISELKSGCYILSLRNGNNTANYKFTK